MDSIIRHGVAQPPPAVQPQYVTLEDMLPAVSRLSDYDLEQLIAAANAEIHDRDHRGVAA